MNCSNCGCPFFTTYGFRTADASRAWQDTDGTWYKGAARETFESVCDGCGRKEIHEKARGKLIRHEFIDPPVTANR